MSEQTIITVIIFFGIFGGISTALITLLILFERGYRWEKIDNKFFKRLHKDSKIKLSDDIYDDNHHLDVDK